MTAYSRGVLLFEAASSNGGKTGRSFPGRERIVIAVHSTDTNGNRSPFSPTAVPEDINFATVGEEAESAWPVQQCDERANTPDVWSTNRALRIRHYHNRNCGLLSYFNTPIHIPEWVSALKSHKRINTLTRVAEKRTGSGAYKPRDGYHFVDISFYSDSLFGKNKDFINLALRDLLSG